MVEKFGNKGAKKNNFNKQMGFRKNSIALQIDTKCILELLLTHLTRKRGIEETDLLHLN